MRAFVNWKLVVLLAFIQLQGLAQSRLVQVKLYNKNMQPVADLQFSFDNATIHKTNDKGVAVVQIEESLLPPQNVYVHNSDNEAESWNYSRGVLEIIIRARTTKVLTGIVRNEINEPIPNLPLEIGRVNKRKVTTNTYGEFTITVPIGFQQESLQAYSIPGYNLTSLNIEKDIIRIKVSELKSNAPVVEAQQPIVKETNIDTDSLENIRDFYSYIKGVSLRDLGVQQQQELNDVFAELVTFYQDSLKAELYSRVSDISDSSRVSDDLGTLIEQAQLERDIATELNRIFAEKIELINTKLASGGDNLSAEEREALISDITLLDEILQENEMIFTENQSEYRSILKSISANLLEIGQLEQLLNESEQQRREQREIYEQRVVFYSVGLGLLLAFLIILAFFLAKLRKEKVKTQQAYQKLNDLNERLEELVSERTAMLEMANAELDTFFYKSAHNLRGPLCTIVGLYEVAKLTLDPESQVLINKVADTASSMDLMLRKLIMVSHINYPSKRDKVNFFELVENIENSLAQMSFPKEVNFTKTIMNEKVNSHPVILDIIVKNLLENAFIFSTLSSRQPHVDISIKKIKDEVIIRVSDNGHGIDSKIESKIWHMFYIGNEGSRGSGLGLYITRKATHALKGTVKYKRVEDQTIFEVILPLEAQLEVDLVEEEEQAVLN